MKTEQLKLPSDNEDAAALALMTFGYDDPGNADGGLLRLV